MKRIKQVKTLQRLIEQIRECTGQLHGELREFTFNAGPNYIPEHFEAQELVPEKIFKSFGKEKSFWFLDSRILWTLDAIREYFGKPVIVNNWSWGGVLAMRGFRPPDSSIGTKLSQHRFGRAADFNLKGIPSEEVRTEIKSHPSDSAFSYITAAEENVNWCHIDCRTTKQRDIFWFKA